MPGLGPSKSHGGPLHTSAISLHRRSDAMGLHMAPFPAKPGLRSCHVCPGSGAVQDQCMRQFGLFSQALRNVQGQLKASQEKSKAVAAAAPPKRRPAPPQGSGQDAGPGSAERGSSAGPRAPNGRRGGPGQGGGGRSRSAVRGSGAEKQRGSGQNGSFSAPRPGVGGPVLLSSSEGPREDYWASA